MRASCGASCGRIIDDDEEEDDETFLVRLHTPSGGCQLGPSAVCEVTIEDDDGPGELHFETREVEVAESEEEVPPAARAQPRSAHRRRRPRSDGGEWRAVLRR